MQHHFHGVIVPHPRFEGDRSNNYYPKYSLILRVFHYPSLEGIGERPQTSYPTYSLIFRVFHYPTPEGKERDQSLHILHTPSERPRTPYPKYRLIIWVFYYPTPEVRRRDPGHPLSLVQPHF